MLHLSISLLSTENISLNNHNRTSVWSTGLAHCYRVEVSELSYNYKPLQTCNSCICRSNLILSIDSPSSISLAWLAVSRSSARDTDSSVTCGRFQTLCTVQKVRNRTKLHPRTLIVSSIILQLRQHLVESRSENNLC